MKPDPELVDELRKYPEGTALIRYRIAQGEPRVWAVGALHGFDDAKTLRRHLRKWIPSAEFLGYATK